MAIQSVGPTDVISIYVVSHVHVAYIYISVYSVRDICHILTDVISIYVPYTYMSHVFCKRDTCDIYVYVISICVAHIYPYISLTYISLTHMSRTP